MRHIGVDLHKTNFVACFLDEQDKPTVKTFALTEQGLLSFQRALTRVPAVRPHPVGRTRGFWEIDTGSVLVHPQEGRLLTLKAIGGGLAFLESLTFGQALIR